MRCTDPHADGRCSTQLCEMYVCLRCQPGIRLRCVGCMSSGREARALGIRCHCDQCNGGGVPIDAAMERDRDMPGPKIEWPPTPGAATKEQPVCQFCREGRCSHCPRYLPNARLVYVPGEILCRCPGSFHQGGWYP